MNKNQSAGMYIVLAIVALVFISSVFLAGPNTSTTEISYSNFLERLNNNEFKTIKKAHDFLIAVPKVQPEAETQTTDTAMTAQNPFGVAVEKKAPVVQYKVLTPNDPDLMKKLEREQQETMRNAEISSKENEEIENKDTKQSNAKNKNYTSSETQQKNTDKK